jgi:hypothetical protein
MEQRKDNQDRSSGDLGSVPEGSRRAAGMVKHLSTKVPPVAAGGKGSDTRTCQSMDTVRAVTGEMTPDRRRQWYGNGERPEDHYDMGGFSIGIFGI